MMEYEVEKTISEGMDKWFYAIVYFYPRENGAFRGLTTFIQDVVPSKEEWNDLLPHLKAFADDKYKALVLDHMQANLPWWNICVLRFDAKTGEMYVEYSRKYVSKEKKTILKPLTLKKSHDNLSNAAQQAQISAQATLDTWININTAAPSTLDF